MIQQFRQRLPDVEFVASPCHAVESLADFDALIPGMAKVTPALLHTADRLTLIQQAGAGLEGGDIASAHAQV